MDNICYQWDNDASSLSRGISRLKSRAREQIFPVRINGNVPMTNVSLQVGVYWLWFDLECVGLPSDLLGVDTVRINEYILNFQPRYTERPSQVLSYDHTRSWD